ncbi:hypothetical protein PG993_006223 [Apiospora rasikravindrae]|uniref:Velvet domain-containing protein n=1 Tax=Apiospora rasikravindrae TaxID=990691 RepID=A0ABR1T536_9PEZI
MLPEHCHHLIEQRPPQASRSLPLLLPFFSTPNTNAAITTFPTPSFPAISGDIMPSDRQNMRIEVQPPDLVQSRQLMLPQMVVSIPHTVKCDFLYAHLFNMAGSPVANSMEGGAAAQMPREMEQGNTHSGSSSSSSSAAPRLYSVFPNLIITHSGKYRIYVEATAMDYENNQTERTAFAYSHEIEVKRRPVAEARVSEKKRELLDTLHNEGFY